MLDHFFYVTSIYMILLHFKYINLRPWGVSGLMEFSQSQWKTVRWLCTYLWLCNLSFPQQYAAYMIPAANFPYFYLIIVLLWIHSHSLFFWVSFRVLIEHRVWQCYRAVSVFWEITVNDYSAQWLSDEAPWSIIVVWRTRNSTFFYLWWHFSLSEFSPFYNFFVCVIEIFLSL